MIVTFWPSSRRLAIMPPHESATSSGCGAMKTWVTAPRVYRARRRAFLGPLYLVAGQFGVPRRGRWRCRPGSPVGEQLVDRGVAPADGHDDGGENGCPRDQIGRAHV